MDREAEQEKIKTIHSPHHVADTVSVRLDTTPGDIDQALDRLEVNVTSEQNPEINAIKCSN